MAIANASWIGVANSRKDRDVINFYVAQARPFIYWKTTNAITGAWFLRDSAGTETTTGITDRDNINGAIAAAAAI